jgi:hypothetical protein
MDPPFPEKVRALGDEQVGFDSRRHAGGKRVPLTLVGSSLRASVPVCGTGIAAGVGGSRTGDACLRPSAGVVRIDQAALLLAVRGQQAGPAAGRLPVTGQALSRSLIPVAQQLDVRVHEKAREQCRWRDPVIAGSGQQVRICDHDELPQRRAGFKQCPWGFLLRSWFLGPFRHAPRSRPRARQAGDHKAPACLRCRARKGLRCSRVAEGRGRWSRQAHSAHRDS